MTKMSVGGGVEENLIEEIVDVDPEHEFRSPAYAYARTMTPLEPICAFIPDHQSVQSST